MKKLDLSILVAALVLTVTLGANAQQAAKVPRIGYLAGGPPDDEKERVAAFQQGLRDLSYVDGKNILVEYRYADGNLDAIKGLVTELMQLKIDVLVSGNFASIRAAKEAIKTIPIVVITAQNPVETGLVESLAHPGGNITGLTTLNRELGGKRLELLKEVIPKLLRVGAIWEVAAPGAGVAFKEYDAAARALKIELQPLKVQGPNPDLEGAFKAAVTGRANALIPIRSTLMGHYRKRIADLAIKNRLPSMNERSEWVEAGGLLSYTASEAESFRRAATYVDKILKGAKPADLPVEQAMKFEFIINLKTARQIGLTIPPNVLVRADRVIK